MKKGTNFEESPRGNKGLEFSVTEKESGGVHGTREDGIL